MKLKKKHKAVVASYGRSVLGAGIALYIAGVTDPKELWAALVAALAPVVLRAINPADSAFGRLPKAKAVEKALKNAKPSSSKNDSVDNYIDDFMTRDKATGLKLTPKKTTAKKSVKKKK
jgi:hypothetical protein